MPSFLLKPDFYVIGKYYQLPQTPEEMQVQFAEGIAIELDWCAQKETIVKIENEFSEIAKKYNVHSSYDNLLFIILNEVIAYDLTRDTAIQENKQAHRTKQLAMLLSTFKNFPEVPNSVELKIKHGFRINTITDHVLINWVAKLIWNASKDGKLPLNQFGAPRYLLNKNGEVDVDELVKAANTKVTNTTILWNRLTRSLNARFCLKILQYLNNETTLKAKDTVNFSDQQLSLLFDTLRLFHLTPDRNFNSVAGYDTKDYMRSTLKSYLKSMASKERKPNSTLH